MVYLFECLKGHVTERVFPHTEFPRRVRCHDCGRVARKILSPSRTVVSDKHKASKSIEIDESNGLATHIFENKVDPSTGMTDKQRVQKGLAKTKDMKREL